MGPTNHQQAHSTIDPMTHEKITETLFRAHTAITGILMAANPEISPELLELLEDAEELLNAIRNELSLVVRHPSPLSEISNPANP
jgi:hypothetical protein